MRITKKKLQELIQEEIAVLKESPLKESPKWPKPPGPKTQDDCLEEFLFYWDKERRTNPELSPDDQPDYDDVDSWSPNFWITSGVWDELQRMRHI